MTSQNAENLKNQKCRKRRIAFSNHPVVMSEATLKNDVEERNKNNTSVPDRPWDFNKELLCVACSKELEHDSLSGLKNKV